MNLPYDGSGQKVTIGPSKNGNRLYTSAVSDLIQHHSIIFIMSLIIHYLLIYRPANSCSQIMIL